METDRERDRDRQTYKESITCDSCSEIDLDRSFTVSSMSSIGALSVTAATSGAVTGAGGGAASGVASPLANFTWDVTIQHN